MDAMDFKAECERLQASIQRKTDWLKGFSEGLAAVSFVPAMVSLIGYFVYGGIIDCGKREPLIKVFIYGTIFFACLALIGFLLAAIETRALQNLRSKTAELERSRRQ